ncbi:hypothetical protein ACJX0J_009380, partial [Zea mays]
DNWTGQIFRIKAFSKIIMLSNYSFHVPFPPAIGLSSLLLFGDIYGNTQAVGSHLTHSLDYKLVANVREDTILCAFRINANTSKSNTTNKSQAVLHADDEKSIIDLYEGQTIIILIIRF